MKEQLERWIREFDRRLAEYLPEKDNPQAEIYKAMNYSLFASGKRLRPMLMLEVCRMCGGQTEETVPFACAMEMIHTYSLIHDDLPAMDNDDLRRGKPTNHVVFGESTAILAGDALLNRAFEIVTGTDISPERALKAAHILALSSGTEGMIGGQVVDIASEGRAITLDQLRYIHLLKTGAIIRSACRIGAVLAGADEAQLAAIDTFAQNLGVAFQIRDDILDVTGTEAELGKPIGSDAQQAKNTYVTLCGLDAAERLCREHSQKAAEALECFGEKADFLRQLTAYLIDRSN